ncbi:MAG: formate dehydrogenase accessory sulfurtransferase FdhD [Terracidiphilus sp.]
METPLRSVELTQVTEWENGQIRSSSDDLAAEEPLQILACGDPLVVTMRTPGHDRELAAGFLWTEGLIDNRDQILGFRDRESTACQAGNTIDVELRDGVNKPDNPQRNFLSNSSCGLCGKASIDDVRTRGLRPLGSGLEVDAETLCSLPEKLRARQSVFERTGGLHAAALFNAKGELVALREDIGRHNAVDKVVGWALLQDMIPLSSHVLLVSGRGGFEIIQKAIAAGVPIAASVSAPSSLAVQLARELNLTLIGFLRGRRFVVYSGQARCLNQSYAADELPHQTAQSPVIGE